MRTAEHAGRGRTPTPAGHAAIHQRQQAARGGTARHWPLFALPQGRAAGDQPESGKLMMTFLKRCRANCQFALSPPKTFRKQTRQTDSLPYIGAAMLVSGAL